MIFREMLSSLVSDAFEAAGYDKKYGAVSISNRPDLCQFQCNGAMVAAKEYKRAPIMIANDVVEKLQRDDRIEKIEAVAPGFINITLTDSELSSLIDKMAKDDRFLIPEMKPETLVIDYGGPNVAKPLHVGHLRAAIIGEVLCRLSRFLGHEVIGDIHLGDWGLQMGLVIALLKERNPDLPYFDEGFSGEYPEESPVTADELNVIYPEASARSKEDEAFAAQAAEITVRLQNHERGYFDLWEKIRQVSIDEMKKDYDILDVHFDKWYGESDADPYVDKLLEILRNENLMRESGGAMIVEVEEPDDREPMPPMIVQKSNGGDVYGTTDVATILQRKLDWDPDEIWYVVDDRQILHFKQVFRVAKLAGILGDTQCHHIYFGTMNGKDGKPYKTREGGVMRLSDFIGTVVDNAVIKVQASGTVRPEEQEAVAAMVGIAAIKIGDLLNHRTKDYIFDIERFLASEGKTGPYLQYTAVRINSVIKKAADAGYEFGEIKVPKSDTERDLMLKLTEVPDALYRAFEDKAPNVVCEILFEITGLLNRFYSENRILTCEDEVQRASWLSLLSLSYKMIITLLDILSISVPENM